MTIEEKAQLFDIITAMLSKSMNRASVKLTVCHHESRCDIVVNFNGDTVEDDEYSDIYQTDIEGGLSTGLRHVACKMFLDEKLWRVPR